MINIGQLIDMWVVRNAKPIFNHSTSPQSAPPFLPIDGKRMEQGLFNIRL
jgi:hypothetical protein